MTQLKLLGAQRIKALTAMLEDKRKAEVREVEKSTVNREVAKLKVAREYGIEDKFIELNALKERVHELNKELSPYGYNFELRTSQSTYQKPLADEFAKAVTKEMFGDRDERIAEINARYKQKEQQLWLCETLEEAKAIVGI